ncbi:MAG TPA: WYL domain-containing protein [Lachnospiraceae bacterium]|nr:WYL domain-containing protein [Lachnospiraceae bacterium]
MARSSNQKLKLLYLLKILTEHTNEQHPMNTAALIKALEAYGISAERKSIYSDIEELIHFGIDIEKSGGRRNAGYYVAGREFELAELKLLVDAVQSSKFITGKKTDSLIRKLGLLTDKYQAAKLKRQVFVANRTKTQNESIFYNIDDIYRAIQDGKEISFQYFEWSINKELLLKKNGEAYIAGPLALIWDDENYYLVAYDKKAGFRKHFRVDKMKNIQVLESRPDIMDRSFDIAAYSKKMFGMFGGETDDVILRCPNGKIGILLDRFGKEITVRQLDGDFCRVRVQVVVSEQFFGWLCAIGTDISIVAPAQIKEQYRMHLKKILDNYE